MALGDDYKPLRRQGRPVKEPTCLAESRQNLNEKTRRWLNYCHEATGRSIDPAWFVLRYGDNSLGSRSELPGLFDEAIALMQDVASYAEGLEESLKRRKAETLKRLGPEQAKGQNKPKEKPVTAKGKRSGKQATTKAAGVSQPETTQRRGGERRKSAATGKKKTEN